MIIPALNQVAFNIFGMPVYWYGIIMAIAIFIAILVADKFYNLLNGDLPKSIILEYAPVIIICGILSARIYFCCLNPSYYFSHPLEIFDIREGGLSIHGGIIGGILSSIFIVKKYKLPFLKILDYLAVGTILGQSLGRWGNYFNSEAYGMPEMGQSWGLYIPLGNRPAEDSQYDLFHPAFLYESILDLIAFGILTFILFKFGKKYVGLTFFSYLMLYGLIRFFIEQIRIDSALNIHSIPIAVLVSIILFVIGICAILVILIKRKQFAQD